MIHESIEPTHIVAAMVEQVHNKPRYRSKAHGRVDRLVVRCLALGMFGDGKYPGRAIRASRHIFKVPVRDRESL
jgi:hypothetical protein